MSIHTVTRHAQMARAIVLGSLLLTLSFATVAPSKSHALSPFDVVVNHAAGVMYVAEQDNASVAVLQTSDGLLLRRIALPDTPGGLALSPDGATLFVTSATPDGALYRVNTATDVISGATRTGHTPGAVALSPDGAVAYVANRFDNEVVSVDAATLSVTTRTPVLREPEALALTPDGALLYVANLLPAGASDGDYVAAAVSVIDTATMQSAGVVELPNGSTGVRGICVSPDGAFVYVTHILARYHLPTTQLERGWMNTNALSIIDAPGKTLVNTVLLDDVDLGAANPWAPVCTPDGRLLCVTHAGSHELSIIDRSALHARLNEVPEERKGEVPNNLAFLVGLRNRIKLPGNGPRGFDLTNDMAYVAQYFTNDIVTVALESVGPRELRVLSLGATGEQSIERRGEMFFNDAALCFQQWQSCASCHPDVRVDGLNWDLLNDGIGNPKNTRSMLLSHQTPPVMGLGVRATAEVAVRAGIKFIQFAVRPEEDAEAIDEFLKALEPVPSPYLENGALSASARRGEMLFKRANCAQCHPEPLYTDLQLHDLGTTRGMDEGKPVDTPTLVEVWRTAPYLHDGRAADMKSLFTEHNPEDRHGKTSDLSEAELDDLVTYVMSL